MLGSSVRLQLLPDTSGAFWQIGYLVIWFFDYFFLNGNLHSYRIKQANKTRAKIPEGIAERIDAELESIAADPAAYQGDWKPLPGSPVTPVLSLPQLSPVKKPYPHEFVKRLSSDESPLKVWREYIKFTLATLAKACGVSIPALSQIENSKRTPAWIYWLSSPRRSAVTWKTLSGWMMKV